MYCQFRRATLGTAICIRYSKHFHVYTCLNGLYGWKWASFPEPHIQVTSGSLRHTPCTNTVTQALVSLNKTIQLTASACDVCPKLRGEPRESFHYSVLELLRGSAKRNRQRIPNSIGGADLWVVFGWSERRWPSSSIIAPSAWSQVTTDVKYCNESQNFFSYCLPVNNFKKC